MTARRVAASVLGVLALTSCGHDSSKPKSAASSSVSSVSPSTAASPGDAHLNSLQLTASELGVTFTSAQLDGPKDTVQPCGQPDPRSVIQPQARDVVLLADYLEGLGVAENLSTFATVQDAQQVMVLLRDGLSCGQGTIANSSGSAPVALSSVQDVSAQVDTVDAFAVVENLADSSQVTTIAARVDRLVVEFQIGAKAKSGSLDPLQIAKQGVDKIIHG